MTGITATPKQITQMIILREAGFSVLHISQQLGFSVRTIHRHLAEKNTKKGTIKKEVIEIARAELTKVITSNPAIREQAAKLVMDDIAHANHLRAILIEASEHLTATNLLEATMVMRGAAAYSTALKNTSDTLRHSFGIDKIKDEDGELPELHVKELTNEQARGLQEKLLVIDDDDERVILDD